MEKVRLYNGVEIPAMGFGPGLPALQGMRGHSLFARAYNRFVARPIGIRKHIAATCRALEAGYELLDYASAYEHCEIIGHAIQASGKKREELFITGRISNWAQFKGLQAVRDEIRRMLEDYGTPYFDLLMFHWPVPEHFNETWSCICEAYEKGLTRSIGVANCNIHHLEELGGSFPKPMINQIEVHPLFTQKNLVDYCQSHGIVVEAYTALARFDGRLMKLPRLLAIAKLHDRTPAQVVLRWHIQKGVVPVIRSMSSVRLRENLDVFDFSLSEQEMTTIDSFNINARLRFDPDNCDFTIL